MMPILELDHVSFTYPNGFEAVKDLCLAVDPGEKVAVIGENGAGKTTMAKLVNGLLRPTAGDVRVNGGSTRAKTVACIARDVGFVFQNPDDQIFNSSIFREITYTHRYNKSLPPSELEKRVREALGLIGLEGKEEENPYNLSYSHRKFITIGTVIMQDPRLVILDEPTAGQDLEGMDRLAEIIDYFHRRNTAVIVIAHDMEFVARCFDRAIVMAHGAIILDDSVRSSFWNLPALREAALQQPYISQLARGLGLPGEVLAVDEFIAAMPSAGRHIC